MVTSSQIISIRQPLSFLNLSHTFLLKMMSSKSRTFNRHTPMYILYILISVSVIREDVIK